MGMFLNLNYTQKQLRSITTCFFIKDFDIDAAHKKGSGSTKNGRDSVSKRRGVKIYGKQYINAGGIIVRQVGSIFHPGFNVGSGKDYTLFALSSGTVLYERVRGRKCVSVYPRLDKKKNVESVFKNKNL